MLNFSLSWVKKNIDIIVLIISILLTILYAFQLGGWKLPLSFDRTFHLYSAQMIAKGAIPYVDFFNIHPPLGIMLIAFPLYLFPSLQIGVGSSIVHSVMTIMWSIGGIIALYYMAKKITGTWIGGLLSISFWMFLTPLFIRYYSVGENRLFVTSSILIAMALLQRGKWYWAGFALASGFMTYYPTALAGVAVMLVILGQKSWMERLKCTAIFSGGFFTIVGMVVLWLLYKGGFVAWIDVTLQWPFAMDVINSNVDRSFVEVLLNKYKGAQKALYGGYKFSNINLLWLPTIGVIGYVYFFGKSIIQKSIKTTDLFFSKEIAPVFMTTLLFYLYLLIEKGPFDGFMVKSFLTIWISLLLVDFVSLLKNISITGYWFSFAIIYVVLIFYGYNLFNAMSVFFDRRLKSSIYLQTEASRKLFENYSEDKKILVLGDLWLLNVASRENLSHFYHTGPKMRLAAKLTGHVTPQNNMFDKLAALNSDLVLISTRRRQANYRALTNQLVDMNYACVGKSSSTAIMIPRDDIYALPAVFNMQQSSSNSEPPNHYDRIEIIDAEDVEKIENLEINEIAMGTLLLGYELDSCSSKTITLYWWNWLDTKGQVSDIFIEAEINGKNLFKQVVNTDRFPKNQVIKQVIELPGIENWVEGGQIIISHDENKLKKVPCLSDFTTGPITIPLSQ